MNVGELKAFLERYPDDMEIANSECGVSHDNVIISPRDWSVIKGVATAAGCVQESYSYLKNIDKSKEKAYLLLSR